MVHYQKGYYDDEAQEVYYYPNTEFPNNEYWRLEAEYVESARTERGFLVYDQCSLDELSQFCKQRLLVPLKGLDATFANLKEILQQADEEATFDRFADLPPELRLRIYEFHRGSLDFNHFSTAPPITAVSKLIRREASSVFFRERLLLIHRERTWHPMGDMSLQMVTEFFFNRAPLCFIQSLRRLEIMAPLRDGNGYAEFEIDLSAKDREKRAFFVSMGTFWAPWVSQRVEAESTVKGVVERLRDLVDVVVARETVAFERGDADAVLRIFASTASTE